MEDLKRDAIPINFLLSDNFLNEPILFVLVLV